jgi:hypothetical protein
MPIMISVSYGYLFLAGCLPATAWTGIAYLSRSLRLDR